MTHRLPPTTVAVTSLTLVWACASGLLAPALAASDGVWTQLAADVPARLVGAAAVYDPVRDRTIVYGGLADDLWSVSGGEHPTWTRLAPRGPLPRARSGHAALYDPLRDRMLVVCGMVDSTLDGIHAGTAATAEVWSLSLTPPETWSLLVADVDAHAAEVARWSAAVVYDAPRDRLVIYGGRTSVEPLCDAWELPLADQVTWRPLATGGPTPPKSFAMVAAYDSRRERLVSTDRKSVV